jgi:hypothetical protein
MASMVVQDSTLESLTPIVNAPLLIQIANLQTISKDIET